MTVPNKRYEEPTQDPATPVEVDLPEPVTPEEAGESGAQDGE